MTHEINTSDFKVMHEMLSEIEIKTLGVAPDKLHIFMNPIRHLIFESWQDVCDENDSFLFPKT